MTAYVVQLTPWWPRGTVEPSVSEVGSDASHVTTTPEHVLLWHSAHIRGVSELLGAPHLAKHTEALITS